MTLSKRETYRAFCQAVTAMAQELSATECQTFLDDDDSYSAHMVVVGREEARNIEEAGNTPKVQYSITLAMTYGQEAIHVMVDCHNRNQTGETRLSLIETAGSDVIEPICRKIGIQSYA